MYRVVCMRGTCTAHARYMPHGIRLNARSKRSEMPLRKQGTFRNLLFLQQQKLAHHNSLSFFIILYF